jgi:hypothetical protein
MNIPRWVVILALLALAWFIFQALGFTSKKVKEFDKKTVGRVQSYDEIK